MPSKDKKVVGVKLTDNEHKMLETYATTHNMTVSAVLGLCIRGLLEGEISIEMGELRVNPIGYAVSEDLDTPFGNKVDRRFEKLRERGYPERVIEMMKEQILAGLDSQIELLPKKYDPRRMRDDCGC